MDLTFMCGVVMLQQHLLWIFLQQLRCVVKGTWNSKGVNTLHTCSEHVFPASYPLVSEQLSTIIPLEGPLWPGESLFFYIQTVRCIMMHQWGTESQRPKRLLIFNIAQHCLRSCCRTVINENSFHTYRMRLETFFTFVSVRGIIKMRTFVVRSNQCLLKKKNNACLYHLLLYKNEAKHPWFSCHLAVVMSFGVRFRASWSQSRVCGALTINRVMEFRCHSYSSPWLNQVLGSGLAVNHDVTTPPHLF